MGLDSPWWCCPSSFPFVVLKRRYAHSPILEGRNSALHLNYVPTHAGLRRKTHPAQVSSQQRLPAEHRIPPRGPRNAASTTASKTAVTPATAPSSAPKSTPSRPTSTASPATSSPTSSTPSPTSKRKNKKPSANTAPNAKCWRSMRGWGHEGTVLSRRGDTEMKKSAPCTGSNCSPI